MAGRMDSDWKEEFCPSHDELEMSLRSLRGNVEQAVRYESGVWGKRFRVKIKVRQGNVTAYE